MLIGASPGASQQDRAARQPELPGQRFGDEVGLVVAAFSLPDAVQRYWDYDVGLKKLFLAPYELEQTLCEPDAKWFHALEFQKQDGRNQLAFVQRKTPRIIKMIPATFTEMAQGVFVGGRAWPGSPNWRMELPWQRHMCCKSSRAGG